MKSIVARCLCSCHNYLLRLVNQNPESFQKTRPFRFFVLRQQVGRFSKGIWGNKNSVILVDLPYQSSIVIPCVFEKSAVLADDLFIDIARDEQDKQVSVDKEAGRVYAWPLTPYIKRSVIDLICPLTSLMQTT